MKDFAAELLISMKQTYTTEDARQLSISQRKCIFPDERTLELYEGEYTFTNCMKQCRIKRSMALCKCIPPFYQVIRTFFAWIYYSYFINNNKINKIICIASMPHCKMKDLECLSKYATNITDVRECGDCELSCANTIYEIEKLSKTYVFKFSIF